MQDVGFRYSSKQQADCLSLAGFAKNEPDGSIYLEVEGEQQALAKFLAWCRKGPNWAEVRKVETSEGQVKNYSGFIVV